MKFGIYFEKNRFQGSRSRNNSQGVILRSTEQNKNRRKKNQILNPLQRHLRIKNWTCGSKVMKIQHIICFQGLGLFSRGPPKINQILIKRFKCTDGNKDVLRALEVTLRGIPPQTKFQVLMSSRASLYIQGSHEGKILPNSKMCQSKLNDIRKS